jgi:competence protein ComEC
MGIGLDWMIFIAQWVASLPGAVGRIGAFGVGPLLFGTAGLLLICLLRTKLRWSGAFVMATAAIWAVKTEPPNIYAGFDGRAAAVRGANGKLSAMINGRDSFALKEWLAADGDARKPDDPSLKESIRCDNLGCIARMLDGRLIALTLSPQALAEDCRRTAVIITTLRAPENCQALVIDGRVTQARGAVALFGDRLDMVVARPPGYRRPWSPGGDLPERRGRLPTDATPAPGDLDVDD